MKSPSPSSSGEKGGKVMDRLSFWELSRRRDDGTLVPPGHPRPLNRRTLRLAASIAPLVFKDLIKILWDNEGYRLFFYFFTYVIRGLFPAWRGMTSAALLNAVHISLSGKGVVDPAKILKLAFLNILASNAHTIFYQFGGSNTRFIDENFKENLELLYLKRQLSLDIPTLSEPRVAPLILEATIFAGFGHLTGGGGSLAGNPSGSLQMLAGLVTTVLMLASNGALLLSTLLQTGSPISPSGFLFLLLCLLPTLIDTPRTYYPSPILISDHSMYKTEQERSTIRQIGIDPQYKQETLLFDMADWVLSRWQTLTQRVRTQREIARDRNDATGASLSILRDSVQAALYAFTAIGIIPSVSLSSMKVTQSSIRVLIYEISTIQQKVGDIVQQIFLAAAFFEALHLEDTILKEARGGVDQKDLFQYCPVPGRRGMRIEAKNLSFTYPGQTKPTLKNINLVIESGETLAIVGLNGGGKSTLVKVLMGLYDYEGSLLINNIEARTYYRPSLHAHTTVCFQDFGKYNLSFGENVGIGGLHRLQDPSGSFKDDSDHAVLMTALARGGADAVLEKLPNGIRTHLDTFWTPPLGKDVGVRRNFGPIALEDFVGNTQPPPSLPKDGEVSPPKNPTVDSTTDVGSPPSPKTRQVGPSSPPLSEDSIEPPHICLSGGQWQRVALARAFMRADHADLVVFDEPSATLDARAEHELFQRIHALSCSNVTKERVRTTIFVSHRFSTTRRADKIAVVEEGTILELGAHKELMERNGRYAEFFNLQASAFYG